MRIIDWSADVCSSDLNCRVDGPAGLAVPDDRGLALVRDADGCDRLGADTGLGQSINHCASLCVPDFRRIVFDPARLWIVLCELALREAYDVALAIEHDAAGTGSALARSEEHTSELQSLMRISYAVF